MMRLVTDVQDWTMQDLLVSVQPLCEDIVAAGIENDDDARRLYSMLRWQLLLSPHAKQQYEAAAGTVTALVRETGSAEFCGHTFTDLETVSADSLRYRQLMANMKAVDEGLKQHFDHVLRQHYEVLVEALGGWCGSFGPSSAMREMLTNPEHGVISSVLGVEANTLRRMLRDRRPLSLAYLKVHWQVCKPFSGRLSTPA